MADANTINLSAATGSGYFTASGAGKTTVTKPTTATELMATFGNNVFVASASNTYSVNDDTSGSWTINMSAQTASGAAVTLGGANDVYTGTANGDSISVAAASVQIKGGAGADSILGKGDDVYVSAGKGNDSISLTGNGIQVLAGDGNDIVSIVGNDAKIVTGASEASDSVFADGASAYVDATSAKKAYVSVHGSDATIKGSTGADSITVDGANAYVYAGAGDDSITSTGDYAYIDAGEGKNSIVAAGREDVITAGSGNDTISVVGASDTITAGAGDDVVSIFGAENVLNAGAGKDSIFVAGKDATITGGAGKDTVSIGATGAVFSDYSISEDTIILGAGKGSAAGTDVVLTSDGVVSAADGGADVKVAAKNNYYTAKLSSTDGKTSLNYAWGSDTAATINLSSANASTPYWINTADNEVADAVTGGKGNDSIVAGSGDTVLGGAGNDSISVASSATNVVVGLQTNVTGDDSVTAADTLYGFDSTDIEVQVDGSYTAAFDGSSNSLKLTGKKGTLQLTNLTSSASAGVDVRILQNGTVTNTEFVASSATVSLDADVAYVYGMDTTSAVTIDGSNAYTIDLSNNKAYGDTRTYKNINVVDASAATGDVFLIGNGNSTLTGGQGNSSLFGFGSKADSLVGGSGNDTFFYANGNGRDTIANYSSGDDDGTNTDIIYFLTADLDLSKTRKESDGTLTFTLGKGSTQKLTVQSQNATTDAANIVYNWKVTGDDTTYHSKYGVTSEANNFTYNSDVSLYYGGTGTDTLTLTDSDSGVLLLGGMYDGVAIQNVEVIDASATSGTVNLWGEAGKNNTLYGGSGTSTLFGGYNGGNDLLVGNAFGGTTTYFFGTNNGKDTISSSSSSDKVMLYDIDEGGIDYTKTVAQSSDTDLKIVLNDGSTLTVSGVTTGVNTFEFSNGNQYSWNADTKLFERVN